MSNDLPLTLKEREEYFEIIDYINNEDIKRSELIQFYYDFFMMIAEIDNGGFYQYLSNSTGDTFNLLYDQTLTYGFTEIHDQMKKVLNIFAIDSIPNDRENRNKWLESFDDQRYEIFDDIDKYFCENGDLIERKFYNFFINFRDELNSVLL